MYFIIQKYLEKNVIMENINQPFPLKKKKVPEMLKILEDRDIMLYKNRKPWQKSNALKR